MLSEVLRRDTLSQAGRARAGGAAKAKPQSDAFWSLFGDAVFAHGLDGAKDRYYALYALTQCLSSATMWAEPYLCDSLLVKYGGHVVFDYSIPLAFIVYLAAASRMEPRKAKAA